MPIDFPSSPTTNQTYSYNNKLWVFNGTAWVGGTVVSLLPAGSMQMYAGAVTQTVSAGVVTTNCPSGWLLANGNAVSRTTYSALFSAIGTTYGTGDGSTTFNLPSMAGRLPMGSGTGLGLNASGTGVTSGTAMTARALGAWFGEETHLLTATELASHTHANTVGSSSGGSNQITGPMSQNATHFHTLVNKAAGPAGGVYNIANKLGNDNDVLSTNTADTSHTHNIGINNVANTPSGSRHDTIPPVLVMNFIIKT
jgi:microcystin-dependent protein